MLLLGGCASEPVFTEDIRQSDFRVDGILVVAPVDGVDPDTGERLAENMAWGLREAGYPAIYDDRPDPGQPLLQGAIDETEFGESVVWLSLRWTLFYAADADNAGAQRMVAGSYRHQVATSIEEWAILSQKAVNMIVAEAVPSIDEFAQPVIYPKGPPVRVTPDPADNRQLASIGDADEGSTVVVSGAGSEVVRFDRQAEGDLQFAQFEPVFEPAVTEAPQPPPPTTEDKNKHLREILVPAPPKPVAGVDRAEPVATAPEPRAASMETMPTVPTTPVMPEQVVSPVSSPGNADQSPFANIDESTLQSGEVDMLTPASAALVTTDPWLTIDEPVAMSEEEFNAEARANGRAEETVLEAVSPLPPSPPQLPSEPQAENAAVTLSEEPDPASDILPQPVSETVVAQTPAAEPSVEPVTKPEIEPATEPSTEPVTEFAPESPPDPIPVPAAEPPQPIPQDVAASAVSAGALDATAPPNGGRPIFVVRPVSGAPGDGNAALTAAIKGALRNINASLTDDPSQATHVLQGSVRVDSPFAGRQKVRIVWRVTGIEGEVTGQAVQENQVPQGSLDGAWGNTANAVANAAVSGVGRLFEQPIAARQPEGLSQPDLPHVGND